MTHEPDPTVPRAATRAGEYDLIRRLGSGGFGVVYEARHRGSGLPYALKRINLSADDAERYRNEALYPTRIASRSSHVLGVHSFFRDPDSEAFYLVTDLIPHGDLFRFLERHPSPLPLHQALEIGIGIAKGLAAIHAQGVIHRDLKPANVLMDQKDGQWVPKITDFGLARSSDSISIGDFASSGYAAPEQIDLMSPQEPLGPDSDLFSFGMILYELLTGTKPTDAKDLREYGRWIGARRAPAPPSAVRRELAAWPQIDTLTASLLEFDRTKRLTSAADAVRSLTTLWRAVESGAVPQQDSGSQEPVVESAAKNRGPSAAIALIVASLGLALLVAQLKSPVPSAKTAAIPVPPVEQTPAVPPLVAAPQSDSRVPTLFGRGSIGTPDLTVTPAVRPRYDGPLFKTAAPQLIPADPIQPATLQAVSGVLAPEDFDIARWTELSFYPSTQLWEFGKWGHDTLAAYLVPADAAPIELNGTSAPIRTYNTQIRLNLASSVAAAHYLRFFGYFVWGDEGPFRIIEIREELPASVRDSKNVSMVAIRPESVAAGFEASANVYYGDEIFEARFRIGRDGSMEMLSDTHRLVVAADASDVVFSKGQRRPASLNGRKSTEWPLPPPVPGSWRNASADEMSRVRRMILSKRAR